MLNIHPFRLAKRTKRLISMVLVSVTIGIDTPEDMEKALAFLKEQEGVLQNCHS